MSLRDCHNENVKVLEIVSADLEGAADCWTELAAWTSENHGVYNVSSAHVAFDGESGKWYLTAFACEL